jgi:hypothetical protein
MFNRFMSLPPLARRAILAVVLFAICCIDDEFPKSGITDFIFVVCISAWFYTVGLVRPTLLFFYHLLRVVIRYHIYK